MKFNLDLKLMFAIGFIVKIVWLLFDKLRDEFKFVFLI